MTGRRNFTFSLFSKTQSYLIEKAVPNISFFSRRPARVEKSTLISKVVHSRNSCIAQNNISYMIIRLTFSDDCISISSAKKKNVRIRLVCGVSSFLFDWWNGRSHKTFIESYILGYLPLRVTAVLSLAGRCVFERGMQTFGNSRTNTRYNQKKLPTPSIKIKSLNELNFTHLIWCN